ncbi:MAG: MoxR family ATPase [Spirochaetaceae bacterium]|jgi:MoxR-like ATPase|nr:MoxR family ATPase [Spirochaetaceae bacterium]
MMNVQPTIERYRAEMGKRIAGQESMIDGLLTALVAGGHVLLEGVPGLAKTLAVKTLAEVIGLSFKRIQFTPDLLPADLTGTLVWEASSSAFSLRRGPVFANIVLADEVNRAPAKVQSALLEAMEEHQVTLGEESHRLPDPFFVLATQNPIEQEGTYPLPEAELDRFLVKLKVDYPSTENEVRIVTGNLTRTPIEPVLDARALRELCEAAEAVFVDPKITEYIVSLIQATRAGKKDKKHAEGLYRYIAYGASVRGSVAVYKCARIRAMLDGRDFVTPDDVKKVVPDTLRHRLVLSYEAEAETVDADSVLTRILAYVKVP